MRTALVLLLLYAPDALAWGLQTHVYFAQCALLLAPLADPELRSAAARFPRLVLAGACLPDLAVVGQFFLRTPVFRRAHLWATLRRIGAAPRDDRDRALTLGYATHLLADVVAHNHFVPEHEARIGSGAMMAHLLSEWAMDDYLPREPTPSDLLEEAGWDAVGFVARSFRCGEWLAHQALGTLIRAERLLRRSRLPRLCSMAIGTGGFEAYLRLTRLELRNLEAALGGGYEDWCGSDPEGSGGDGGANRRPGEHVAWVVQAQDDT